jgi:DNA-directed RNA polymerase subunit RPC12/RpoP
MSTTSFKCPNCGAAITYVPGTEHTKCPYCLSAHTLDALIAKQKEEATKAQQSEIQERKPEIDQSALREYICNSCGAQVVTDETTSSTICYYCHNPVIINDRISGEFLPDKIVPFQIDRDAAVERFLKWARSKRYVPKDFTSPSNLEKITGIYLPYWVANAQAEMDIVGRGENSRSWRTGDTEYTETKIYQFERQGTIEVNNISELAYSKFDKDLLRSIEPYKAKQKRDFALPYLTGFFAERYDIGRQDVEGRLDERARRYALSLARDSYSKYSNVRTEREQVDTQIVSWEYTLLPVWVLTYHYGSKTYVYAMNGQTGEAFGELPLNNRKLALTSGVLFTAVAILVTLGGWLIW